MSDYIKIVKNEISKWENEGPGFLSQVGYWILWPVEKNGEEIIPQGVQDAGGKAVESALGGLSNTANLTINQTEVKARVSSYFSQYNDEIKSCDEASKHYWNYHLGYAVIEGGALGAGGLASLAADIPALFSMSFRLIQEISLCYGYDIETEEEKEYMMHILRVGSTCDVKAKMEFIICMKQIEELLIKVTWKKMSTSLVKREISKLSLIAALRNFAKSLGIQVTKRKALQMIPMVGALVGASFNYAFINDVGKAAHMSYRRRKISELEKLSPNQIN